jgi:type VI protein secretion system component VasK
MSRREVVLTVSICVVCLAVAVMALAWTVARHNDRLLVLEDEQVRQAQVIDDTHAEALELADIMRRTLALLDREMAE